MKSFHIKSEEINIEEEAIPDSNKTKNSSEPLKIGLETSLKHDIDNDQQNDVNIEPPKKRIRKQDLSQKNYKEYSSSDEEEKTHQNISPNHKCIQCQQAFQHENDLVRHISIVHRNDSFIDRLIKHKDVENDFNEEIENNVIEDFDEGNNKLKDKYDTYTCMFCGLESNDVKSHNQHNLDVHGGIKENKIRKKPVVIRPYGSGGNATKRRRCGECEGCLRDECGECVQCLDKPKYGGNNIKKGACIERACLFPPKLKNKYQPVKTIVAEAKETYENSKKSIEHKCSKCQRIFSKENDLMRHISIVHKDVEDDYDEVQNNFDPVSNDDIECSKKEEEEYVVEKGMN